MTLSTPQTYLYCPMCGTKYLHDQDSKFHLHCHHCDYIFHENLRLATGAIIQKAQQILLVKRAIQPRKDTWDLPGGFSEPTEHPKETIIREIKEELGIKAKVIKLFGIYAPNPYLYQKKLNYVCDLFYLVKPLSDAYHSADDVISYQFFPIHHLPPAINIAFPTTRQALKDLLDQYSP